MSSPASAPADQSGRGGGDPILALADRCVQCGLCLPHCPTYRLDRSETESPRGRIALARAYVDGALEPDPVADAHLDHCLGCRRCEAVCPAGVQYGDLLVEVRQRQRERRGAGRRQLAIEWLAARPALLDRLLGVYRALYPLLPKRLPRPPRTVRIERTPSRTMASPKQVALFRGCVARRYDMGVHAALARLCAAAGLDVAVPESQTCCGALHAHAGNREAAAQLALCNRAAFAVGVPVLSSASGCHEALAEALDGHAPVRDACAFLLTHADALRFRPVQVRVALHVPCTQRAVVKSDAALRALLARIPQLDLVELPDTGCCGAAGSYMFDQPERAHALRQPVLDAYARSGASLLLSANIGCRLHLAMGDTEIPMRHPLQFLAEHLAGPSSS
ncbi:MAG TPA: (Fe-S)-binding protein [Xanthomonadaceae bacterium]|jgi:glycolate oxidase iron-sulfur subunit|nr:(Fe-S)-binding protein [Xanthomonadaceae bacterium]